MLQKHFFLMVLAAGVIAIPVFSQEPAGSRPSFEVASVKPSTTGADGTSFRVQPGRLTVTNGTFRMVMAVAYKVRDFQISGGPNWTGTDRWNIEAKAEEGSVSELTLSFDPAVTNPLLLMLQSLLEDRFQLKMHREPKDMPVYELAVAKGGPKIKLSADQSPIVAPERGAPLPPKPQRGGPMPRGAMAMGRGSVEANGVPIANFIQGLSQQLGRPIVDKTGLKGFYDIKLQWTPELGGGLVKPGGPDPDPPADASGPSIFTAIQEQLGLRLDSAKGPVDILVIDSVQKPTEN